jgi:type IV secretion system protein VirD4
VYTLSRLMLLLAVLLFAYTTVAVAILTVQQQVPPDKQRMVWVILIVAVIALIVRKRGRRIFSAMGTAAWASWRDLERAGMLHARTGLILGRIGPADGTPLGRAVKALLNVRLRSGDACRTFFDSLNPRKRKQGQLVRLPQAVHTMVVSPTGGGKGVSCITPFLLTCEESCVVVDFKGENAILTAERRRRMGQKIVILDPFKTVTQSKKLRRYAACFNPVDFLPANEQALDECRDLAEALVIRTGEEKDPHWGDSAEAVIAAAIATTAMYGQKDKGTRSLQAVRDILAHPQKFEIARKLMIEHGGMLARWGGQLEHFQGDELGSVMSTSNRHLRFLDTRVIAESTGSSSFDPAGLRKGKGKMTIYLVLPPEHMRAQSALLRMWIGSLFRACLRGGLRESNKVTFVLDESASMGHMQQLEDSVDKYRGYGVRLQFYYQSLGQLKKCWPSDQGQTLLSNTTKVFFGCNDYQTAEFLSKSLGNETIIVDSGGSNNGWSKGSSFSSGGAGSSSSNYSRSGGSNTNWAQQTRELLKPDELMQLDARIAITLTPGVRPIWTKLIRYYEEKALLRRRGLLRRLAAACRTFLVSAVLLVLAIAAAKAVNSDLGGVTGKQQQQVTPSGGFPPPRLVPQRGRRP